MSLLDYITPEAKKLRPDIISKLELNRTNYELMEYAKALPDPLYPVTAEISGTIIMYTSLCVAASDVEEYIHEGNDILGDTIKKCFLKYSKEINKILKDEIIHNYMGYDHISSCKILDYLLSKSSEDYPFETPLLMFFRIAIQFYEDESFDKIKRTFYSMLNKLYIHATPTLLNAGKKVNQMASCFILRVPDNLEGILREVSYETGIISKFQGGIGMSLSDLRHSSIGNNGESKGVLPFACIADSTIQTVDQGSTRPGAMQITLRDCHYDFPEFIKARDTVNTNGIRLKQANTCVFISDLFMEYVASNKNWYCFCPTKAVLNGKRLFDYYGHEFSYLYPIFVEEAVKRQKKFDEIENIIQQIEKDFGKANLKNLYIEKCKERALLRKNLIIYRVVNAEVLFQDIIRKNSSGSFPSVCFSDPTNYKCNQTNIGTVESMNLCLEITEVATPNSIASCNLASINLKAFVEDGKFNFQKLGEMTQDIVENLNKVIDKNWYPLSCGKITNNNFENRPLGIGVSGFCEVLKMLRYPYESSETEMLNKKIFACMYYNAILRSIELAKKSGSYENYNKGEREYFIDGKWKRLPGSPFYNGFLQFDLWQQESNYLKSIDKLASYYNTNDDIPIEPEKWGQLGSWKELKGEMKNHGIRNSMLLALMPTASTSSLFSSTESVEDHQTLVYSRKTIFGNFTIFSKSFVNDMIRLGIWNKDTYEFVISDSESIKNIHKYLKDDSPQIKEIQKIHKGMVEVSQKTSIKYQRQRGIYIDQSESHNHFFEGDNAKINKIAASLMYSHGMRVKTGSYYIRNVLKSVAKTITISPEMTNVVKSFNEECMMCSS